MKEGVVLKEQKLNTLPVMPNLEAIAEEGNTALKNIFKGKIRGYFMIYIKNRVLEILGSENLLKYYNFYWSNERMISGIGDDTAEYDICRMIVGIHRANSIFLSKDKIRANEKDEAYKQQLISETIEKIKLRLYGSTYFRKKMLVQGEEFLYYPLPYELFVMSVKMNEILKDSNNLSCFQLYYGVIYNGISALSLLEDNLPGTAYPLCRGAIEMYLKLLIVNIQPELYDRYEEFRMLEIDQSCIHTYPENFNAIFEKRICQTSKSKAGYLHFGWVDFIDGYHNIVKKSPYSIYGILAFLKEKKYNISELERLERFYKSCHAYTHGSIQIAIYPVLHYFEISIMLYYIIRGTFLLLCKEKDVDPTGIEGCDIIIMIDRDFKKLYGQYEIRSTEEFEKYYNSGLFKR